MVDVDDDYEEDGMAARGMRGFLVAGPRDDSFRPSTGGAGLDFGLTTARGGYNLEPKPER